jgi:hypothetical protein
VENDPYYSQKAQEMRELAIKAHSRLAKDKLLKLALEYDTLAKAAREDPNCKLS